MFQFIIWFCAIGWVVYLVWSDIAKNWDNKSDSMKEGYSFLAVILKSAGIFIGALLISIMLSALVVIPAGYKGVVFSKIGGVQPRILNEGWQWITPLIETSIPMEVRIRKISEKADAVSKDLQQVTTDVAINYDITKESVNKLYQEIGLDYIDRIINPAIQEAVKSCTAQYSAQDLIVKRQEVKMKILEMLKIRLAKCYINAYEVNITNFNFSQDFNAAIEQKQTALQNALTAKNVLEQVRTEAEQKVAKARAEAESLRLQKEQVTEGLIKLRQIEMQTKAVEKWDGKLPEYMMGSSVPFINLNNK